MTIQAMYYACEKDTVPATEILWYCIYYRNNNVFTWLVNISGEWMCLISFPATIKPHLLDHPPMKFPPFILTTSRA